MHKFKIYLMKKTISLLAFGAIMIALIFSGCKKGENDPFLTLKYRTGRLAQEWKMSSEDITVVEPNLIGGTNSTVYSYDGTSEKAVLTQTSGSYSQTTTTTYTYSMEISFDKDGTFKSTEINDGNATVTEGTWMWMSKNKNESLKDKEAIVMYATKVTDSNGDTETYGGKSNDSFNDVVVFDKLASDEIIMKIDNTNTDSNGDTYSMSGTQTFSKK